MRLLAPHKSRVAVIGAMRSGTNLVTTLLVQHWHIRVDDGAYGWKHSGVPVFKHHSPFRYPKVPIILVTKDPYAFVLSMFKYSNSDTNAVKRISLRGSQIFDDFLRSPIYIWDSQLSGSPEMRFSDPIEYWNFLHWNIVSLNPKRFKVIQFRYEDILENPSILQRISAITKARQKLDEINLPANVLKRGNGSKQNKTYDREFNGSIYTHRKYLENLSSEQISFISARVDRSLMKTLGYDLVEVRSTPTR